MLSTMRELVFRMSIDAARYPNRSIFQSLAPEDPRVQPRLTANWTQPGIAYTGRQPRTVYRTDWRFVGAAAAVGLLCGVLGGVLPLFWGWWQLGRAVSLNPLDVARAFGAPLLLAPAAAVHGDAAVPSSYASCAEWVRACGATRVRYGAVVVVEAAAPGAEQARAEAAQYPSYYMPLTTPPVAGYRHSAAASTALASARPAGVAKVVLRFEEDGDEGNRDGNMPRHRPVAKPEPGEIYD
jgi:hypothetical protein